MEKNKSGNKIKKKILKNKKNSQGSNPLLAKIGSLAASFKAGMLKNDEGIGRMYLLGHEDMNALSKIIETQALKHQIKQILKKAKDVVHFQGVHGPVWIICNKVKKGPFSHSGRLEDSVYSGLRDQVGTAFSSIKSSGVEKIQIELHMTSEMQDRAFLVAADLFGYSYKAVADEKMVEEFPVTYLQKFGGSISKQVIQQAKSVAAAVNLARHMVNAPPNFLNPLTAAQLVKQEFSKLKNIKLDIWDEKKLEKEGMGLHVAVGQGAQHGPCMIHLKYRPKGKTSQKLSKLKPIAFVGKGITFDSGGYDIKPSSGMRYMKKDMGGAAAVLGLAKWAAETEYSRPLDFYLAMAENMVDAKSFRPSDVVTARSGMKVEIHNTDAEGRLVLADCLDVAVTKSGDDEPEMVINVATLTGAIKVALGADIAGLFSNEDGLAEALNKAGQASGELNWRMPLFSRYANGMLTPFADIVNAVDGFAGAITAALFLEKFVKQKPWAHLDIYAWSDKASGALTFAGGNGQPVQCLIHFLEGKVEP